MSSRGSMEDPDNTRAGKRTKQKLAQMMNAFDDFEGVMKEGTRVRNGGNAVLLMRVLARVVPCEAVAGASVR